MKSVLRRCFKKREVKNEICLPFVHWGGVLGGESTIINLANSRYPKDLACSLYDELPFNNYVTWLILSNTFLEELGAKLLASGVATNRTLKRLEVQSCAIGPSGCSFFAEALCHNTSLEFINLSNNGIMCDGLGNLAFALKINRYLKVLHLASNGISERGTAALSDALVLNEILKELDLSFNIIGDVGLKTLSNALKLNITLNSLKLDSNSLTTPALQSFFDSLLIHSATITSCSVKFNNYPEIEAENILKTLTFRNADLQNKVCLAACHINFASKIIFNNVNPQCILNLLPGEILENVLRQFDAYRVLTSSQLASILEQAITFLKQDRESFLQSCFCLAYDINAFRK